MYLPFFFFIRLLQCVINAQTAFWALQFIFYFYAQKSGTSCKKKRSISVTHEKHIYPDGSLSPPAPSSTSRNFAYSKLCFISCPCPDCMSSLSRCNKAEQWPIVNTSVVHLIWFGNLQSGHVNDILKGGVGVGGVMSACLCENRRFFVLLRGDRQWPQARWKRGWGPRQIVDTCSWHARLASRRTHGEEPPWCGISVKAGPRRS